MRKFFKGSPLLTNSKFKMSYLAPPCLVTLMSYYYYLTYTKADRLSYFLECAGFLCHFDAVASARNACDLDLPVGILSDLTLRGRTETSRSAGDGQ